MDAADLKVFEAVARLGGMNRAASELNTVQSSVTSRIRLLEQRIGTPLFRRHSRGVALTDAGKRLLPYAIRIAELLDEAKRAVEDDGQPKGQLTIGSMETTAAYRLPPLIATFGKAHPAVSISLRTGTNLRMIEDVINHRLDGAFVCGPIDHADLEQHAAFTEQLVIATAPGSRRFEARKETGELSILVKGPGCAYRQRFEAMLQRDGIRFSIMEFGTLDAIIGCVAAGLGETLLPQSVLAPALREQRIAAHPLPAADARVETLFIRRRDAFVSSALAAFLQSATDLRELASAAE